MRAGRCAGGGSFGALLVGRLVYGLGAGGVMSAGAVWVVELSRDAAPGAGARRATIALSAGFGLGALVAGAVAQYGPAIAVAALPGMLTGALGGAPIAYTGLLTGLTLGAGVVYSRSRGGWSRRPPRGSVSRCQFGECGEPLTCPLTCAEQLSAEQRPRWPRSGKIACWTVYPRATRPRAVADT